MCFDLSRLGGGEAASQLPVPAGGAPRALEVLEQGNNPVSSCKNLI